MKVGTDGIMLGAWADVQGAHRILDIGTGTGLIALMLAQRTTPDVFIDGVEVDKASCQQAHENMLDTPWYARLNAIPSSIQDYTKEDVPPYDLIVSNPPFFTGGTISHNQDRHSVRHTVKLPHNELIAAVRGLLAPSGRLAVILPYIEGLRFMELAERYHLYCHRLTEVLPKLDKPVERLLLELAHHPPTQCQQAQLVIQQSNTRNDWTAEFFELTKDFYLEP